jgi:hypothetical protein
VTDYGERAKTKLSRETAKEKAKAKANEWLAGVMASLYFGGSLEERGLFCLECVIPVPAGAWGGREHSTFEYSK